MKTVPGRITAAIVLALSGLWFATAQPAIAASSPTIGIDPGSGPPGTTIAVSGALVGCDAENYVVLHVTSSSGAREVRVPVTAHVDGDDTSYATQVTVPLGAYKGGATVEIEQNNCYERSYSATASFNITNEAPVAGSFSLDTKHDDAVTADLAGHVSDSSDGYEQRYEIADAPAHGVAEASGSTVSYTPSAGFAGSDRFSYRACDQDDDDPTDASCSNAAAVTVTVTPPVSGMSVSVAPTTACTDSSATASAGVTVVGQPAASIAVRFDVTMPGQPTLLLQAGTTAAGIATVTYRRPASGSERIRATASFASDSTPDASDSATRVWEECVVTLGLAPSHASSGIGSSFAKTATANYRGRPAADARVTFTATGTATSTAPQSRAADSSGRATASFDCIGAGIVTIRAATVIDGRTGTATATHACTKPPPNALVVALAPAGTESLAGSPATFTALVTDGGAPVAGATVNLRARMPGQPDVSGSAMTTASGTASFPVTRRKRGADTVTAHAVVGGRSGDAQVLHFWRVVPGLTVTLSPAGTTSEVNQPWTATATVRLDRKAVQGAAVRFSASMANQRTISAAARTKSDGTASLRFTRATPGLDTVLADITLRTGQRGQASVAHLWRKGRIVSTPPPTLATNPPSTLPGGVVTATGEHCAPASSVTLRLGNTQLGRTTADVQGRYSSRIELPDLRVGRHILTAICGGRSVTTPVDLVVQTSQTGTAAPAAITTAAVLTFFVLLGGQLLRPSSAAALQTPTT